MTREQRIGEIIARFTSQVIGVVENGNRLEAIRGYQDLVVKAIMDAVGGPTGPQTCEGCRYGAPGRSGAAYLCLVEPNIEFTTPGRAACRHFQQKDANGR